MKGRGGTGEEEEGREEWYHYLMNADIIWNGHIQIV